MKNSDLEKISKTQIASGLIGMVCPIPIIGEAALAGFIYPSIKQIGIFEESKPTILIASLAIAGLTRFNLYQPIYLPMLDYFSRILN